MTFNEQTARGIAAQFSDNRGSELGLIESFVQVCKFLHDNPERFSGRNRSNIALILTESGLENLAKSYFTAYRRSDLPKIPNTVPDEIVSIVMMEAFDYNEQTIDRVKLEHQLAMSAENSVGALLERYLDSVLRPYGWHWCCGSFIRAVDFIRSDDTEGWLALQIKNRDNSENSSSSAIRHGTTIQKWFRSFSRTGKTNWANLPTLMQGYNLSEEGFRNFVRVYLQNERKRMEGDSL